MDFKMGYLESESGPNLLPHEIFPDEISAIDDFTQGRPISLDVLDSLLINVEDERETFHRRNRNSILPGLIVESSRNDSEYPIRSLNSDTKRRYLEDFFSVFGSKSEFNWDHVIAAGGFVVEMLSPDTDSPHFFYDGDLDLFLYGLSENQALEKIEEILYYLETSDSIPYTREQNAAQKKFFEQNQARDKEIQRRSKQFGLLMRTDKTITIQVKRLPFPVQIILRLYQHPAEILLNFDLPCTRCCMNGTQVYMLKSARNAWVNGYNLATGFQPFRTGTYETRLLKYTKRGFGIRVLNFQPYRINKGLFKGVLSFLEVRGLFRLLYLLEVGSDHLAVEKPLIDDYFPYTRMIEIFRDGFEYGNPIPSIWELDLIYGVYQKRPFFAIELLNDRWPHVFQSDYRFYESYMAARNAIHPEDQRQMSNSSDKTKLKLGPLRFIGSTQEYMASLPQPGAWYCQAYGLPESGREAPISIT